MTTLPPEPTRARARAGGPPAPACRTCSAQVAEGFGADAGRYDRARPSYPADLVDRIIAASPGRDVLDAGCGTGISSRLFQAAGCRVLGVDPDPRMAEPPPGRAAPRPRSPSSRTGTRRAARSTPVIAAQAWHWVDPVAGAAKAAAVLRPGRAAGGVLERLRAAARRCARRSPRSTRGCCRTRRRRLLGAARARRLPAPMGGRAADGIRQAGAFGEPEEWLSPLGAPYTRAEWLDLVPTTGGFTRHAGAGPGAGARRPRRGRRRGGRPLHHGLHHARGHRRAGFLNGRAPAGSPASSRRPARLTSAASSDREGGGVAHRGAVQRR